MSAKLLQKIVNNYHTATQLHAEIATTMQFIGMQGYAMLHEFQYLTESLEMRKVKKYAVETYSVYLLDEIPESAGLAEPLIGSKNRRELSQDDVLEILRESWRVYEQWERDTLALYSGIARELFDNGDIAAFNMVSGIIDDVKAELDNIVDMVMELEAMSWDSAQIVADQRELVENYRQKMNELRVGDVLV